MTRLSAKMTKILAATMLLGGAIASVNCSKSARAPTATTAWASCAWALTASGVKITSVHYKIVKSDMSSFTPAIEGDINTSDDNSTASVAHSVPASQGDIAILTATTADAAMIPCSGQSAGFNIVAGQEQGVNVNLICGGSMTATTSGTATVMGTVILGDNCPVLTSWMASPLQTSAPNGLIDVSAAATDADTGELLTYAWTATAGSFTNAAAATTQYKCTTVGMQTLTVTVTDNHIVANPLSANCPVAQTFQINCANTVFCGNGTVDPGTTEQCDPPKPGFCDANCQNVPPKCGDGIVQMGEACDDGMANGTDGICAADCTAAPIVCGDGHVTGSETCDPPNLATCTGTSCCDTTCHTATFDVNPACQACEQKSYTTGKAKFSCVQSLYSGTSGFACASLPGTATTGLQGECNDLRNCIASTHCAGTNGYNADDPTPCYCGALNPTDCVNMGAPTTSACYGKYVAALVGGPSGTVFDLFTNPASPVGVANNLVKCDIDAVCTCGQ